LGEWINYFIAVGVWNAALRGGWLTKVVQCRVHETNEQQDAQNVSPLMSSGAIGTATRRTGSLVWSTGGMASRHRSGFRRRRPS
jgi:hypothetical protein